MTRDVVDRAPPKNYNPCPRIANVPNACAAPQIRRYLTQISGRLPDCIDIHIHIEAPTLPPEELMIRHIGESSASLRRRGVEARELQLARMGQCNGAN